MNFPVIHLLQCPQKYLFVNSFLSGSDLLATTHNLNCSEMSFFKTWGDGFREISIVQSAIGCGDLHTQVQKFWNIYINLTFKKVFSGKISSGMEHFKASRNQRFYLPPTMVGSGIRQYRQSLYPWTWTLPCTAQIEILC